MGRPKQLLHFKGKNLLYHTVQAAIESNAGKVIVVTGAYAGIIKENLQTENIIIAENKQWQEGMASSIRCGMKALLQNETAADAVIIMVCDQPFISSSLLNELMATHLKTGKPIVASQYGTITGTPALFYKTMFTQLILLKGESGAKKIITQHLSDVAVVEFIKGMTDIDTQEDYDALQQE